MDWTEFLRDRRDIFTGQTGHVHRMVATQVEVSRQFFFVDWFFSLCNLPTRQDIPAKLSRDIQGSLPSKPKGNFEGANLSTAISGKDEAQGREEDTEGRKKH